MECREFSELLLGYAAGELDPGTRDRFERHMEGCAACRTTAERQQSVWKALDEWRAPAVSPDFEARLARLVARDAPWWTRFIQAMRPVLVSRTLPIAAAAGLAITAFLIHHPAGTRTQPTAGQIEPIRADQQESVVEDMQMLEEFNGLAHADAADSSM